jgi:hypothetical protein
MVLLPNLTYLNEHVDMAVPSEGCTGESSKETAKHKQNDFEGCEIFQ